MSTNNASDETNCSDHSDPSAPASAGSDANANASNAAAAPPAANALAAAAPPSNGSYTQMWQCDICNTAVFATRELAEEHERDCRAIAPTETAGGDALSGKEKEDNESGGEPTSRPSVTLDSLMDHAAKNDAAKSANIDANSGNIRIDGARDGARPGDNVNDAKLNNSLKVPTKQIAGVTVGPSTSIGNGNKTTNQNKNVASQNHNSTNPGVSNLPAKNQAANNQKAISTQSQTGNSSKVDSTGGAIAYYHQNLTCAPVFNEDSARNLFHKNRQQKQHQQQRQQSFPAVQKKQQQPPQNQNPSNQQQQPPHPNHQVNRPMQDQQMEVDKRANDSQADNKSKEPQLSPGELTEWANSLVDRWWEVFWEPDAVNAASSENNGNPTTKCDTKGNVAKNSPKTNMAAATVEAMVGLPAIQTQQERGQQQQGLSQSMVRNSAIYQPAMTQGGVMQMQNNQLQMQFVSASQRVQQQGLQHAQIPPQWQYPQSQQVHVQLAQQQQLLLLQRQQQLLQNSQPPKKLIQPYNLVYNTPSLGLSLILVKNSHITVKSVNPSNANSKFIKVNDRVVGINGKRFNPPITGKETFQLAISSMKGAKRPVSVMFERLVEVNNTKAPVAPPPPAAALSRPMMGQQPGQVVGYLPSNLTQQRMMASQYPQYSTSMAPSSSLGSLMSPLVNMRTPALQPASAYPAPFANGYNNNYNYTNNYPTNRNNGNQSARMVEDLDDVPLNVLKKRQQQEKDKNQHKRKKREYLDDSSNDEEEDDEDESDEEEDDIDWYDAKILSYTPPTAEAPSGKFTVHFLGDEPSVTYTMSLMPKVVRPSVRAWTRRALSLLCFEGNLLNSDNTEEDGGKSIWTKLPPSTVLPEDASHLKEMGNNSDTGGKDGDNNQIRLIQYKKLLQIEQFLATRLSPHEDEDEDDEEEDEDDEKDNEEGGDGPGPLADSNYVKYLCHCMKEAEIACDWLMGESVVLEVIHYIQSRKDKSEEQTISSSKNIALAGTNAACRKRVSREVLLSFLVNGARFLNNLRGYDPNDKEAASQSQQQNAREKRTNKRGRKKRRVSNASANGRKAGTGGKLFSDNEFGSLLSKALVSDDSLEKMLSQLLPLLKKNAPSSRQQKQQQQLPQQSNHEAYITATLTQLLKKLYEELWAPLAIWIHTSNNMTNTPTSQKSSSSQFYSLGQVEMQLQSASQPSSGNFDLVNLSHWTSKLEAKLKRASLFERKAWTVIQACAQPVVVGVAVGGLSSTSDAEDECIITLQRLKEEASPSLKLPSSSSSGTTSNGVNHMHNLNPLGRQIVNSSGLSLPSSLTRAVLNDAITLRRWVLDLNQAKAIRERASFVQDIIQRYVTLPQLPTPPYDGRLDDNRSIANPSAILAANTKDSITLLSSNCYSYNHIICNTEARLQRSCIAVINNNGNNNMVQEDAQAIFLRTKDGVSSALAELTKLPIVSLVEEKLLVREELIEWNGEAQRFLMRMSSSTNNNKLPFSQIEALHKKLLTILNMQSDRRLKLCQKLKPNPFIEDQVRSFAVADEHIICPMTGGWLRDQYQRGTEWMKDYNSIVTALQQINGPSLDSDSSVDVNKITSLLEGHDHKQHLAASFPKEYAHLHRLKDNITQWTNAVHQILLSDSLTFEDRWGQLEIALSQRPLGATSPAREDINMWIHSFRWRHNLQLGIKRMMDHFTAWKTNQAQHNPQAMQGAEYQEVSRLIRSVLAPLMIEGQDFLIEKEVGNENSFLVELRNEALQSISTSSGQTLIRKMDVLASGNIHGKAVVDAITNMEADKQLGSCLLLTRRVFWMMLFQCFFQRLETLSDNFSGALSDAKALLSLCPHGLDTDTTSSFVKTKAAEFRLQKLIDDAENLGRQSSVELEQCTALLQNTNCFLHKEQLRMSLLRLSDIQSNFKSKHLELAVKLLKHKDLQNNVQAKVNGLTWLVSTFAYDLFDSSKNQNVDENSRTSNPSVDLTDRIHLNNLKDLHDTLPVSIESEVTGDCLDREIVRICIMVKDLWDCANLWQKNVASIIPTSNESEKSGDCAHVVKVEDLVKLTEDKIVSKVIMPELDLVQNATALALQFNEKLKELFREEINGTTDVNKARLPDGKSLIANNGDYILHRFTGSEMYATLRETLNSIKENAARIPITTPEKATLEWMANIFDWVESIQNAGHYSNEQLFIKIDHALKILEQGHAIMYSVQDEVQLFLKGEKVRLQVFPQIFDVAAMKGGTHSLGLGLLRWAALLFECVKSDVDKEDVWKECALESTNLFETFESESVMGSVSSFRDATQFKDNVLGLIRQASELIIQDDELMCSLSALPKRMETSILFQKSLEAEKIAVEKKKYFLEKEKFENTQNIVDDRYELLNSLMGRRPPSPELDDIMNNFDDNSLFIGEPSVRDKSRFFLEKSLLTGMETLGLEQDDDAQNFCSIFAWNLEHAVNENFPYERMKNEYRDKIRSLRFNLQDPKNPMLCARVIAGDLSMTKLISASTEELASKEMKQKRKQVVEESIKSVVLCADSTKQKILPEGISSERAAKIRIDEATVTKSQYPGLGSALKPQGISHGPEIGSAGKSILPKEQSPEISPTLKSEEDSSQDQHEIASSTTPLLSPALEEYLSKSPDTSSIHSIGVTEARNQLLASIPPPPMQRAKSESVTSTFAPDDEFPSPPPSPLLSPVQSEPVIARSPRAYHITSKSGTDLFQITISKLKLSFTTKMAADQSSKFDVDSFLPSILVEKGRLSVEQFNKFVHEKTKSGKWNLAHLKLSSIEGSSNMSSYKKFYKEYESVGRLTMIQVSDTTKLFLVTPKFLRVCKCLNGIENLSKSSTYVVVLTKDCLPQKHH